MIRMFALPLLAMLGSVYAAVVDHPAGSGPGPATPFTALPATFGGDLPCADCPGIRYRLNLFADHSFFLQTTHLERTDATPHDDIGSWDLSSDGRILALQGGREAPLLFRIGDADTLHMLDLDGRDIVSELNYALRRSQTFEPLEPHLQMRGMYRYLADAALFDECLSGRRWPVDASGDNLALERAYLAERQAPGQPLMVSLEGRVAMRPAIEGEGMRPALVPERFVSLVPGESCPPRFRTAPLPGTDWRLVQLEGEALFVERDEQRPYLRFADDGRVGGSGGCNRLTGAYATDGDTLQLGPLAATRMACAEGMQTEADLFAALDRVTRWNVIGRVLELYDERERLLARFHAAPDPQARAQ